MEICNGLNIKDLDLQKEPKPYVFSNTKCRGTYCNGYKRKININTTHKAVVTKIQKRCFSAF